MRKAVIAGFALAAAFALAVAGTATGAGTTNVAIPGCAKGSLNLLEAGKLTVGTDNPAFPPWFGGAEKKPWKVSNPYSGKGYESAVVYAIASQLGFTKAQVDVDGRAVQQLVQAGEEAVRLLRDAGVVLSRAGRGRSTSRAATTSSTSRWWRARARRSRRSKTIAGLKAYKLGAQVGTTSYTYITRHIRPSRVPERVRHERRGHPGAQERPDRRHRRRPADGVLRHRRAARRRRHRGQAADEGHDGAASVSCSRRATRSGSCVDRAIGNLWANGTIKKIQNQYLARAGAPDLK